MTNDYLIAALFVAGIGCGYKLQYQGLMYILAVAFGGVYDLPRFVFVTFIYIFVSLLARFIAASR